MQQISLMKKFKSMLPFVLYTYIQSLCIPIFTFILGLIVAQIITIMSGILFFTDKIGTHNILVEIINKIKSHISTNNMEMIHQKLQNILPQFCQEINGKVFITIFLGLIAGILVGCVLIRLLNFISEKIYTKYSFDTYFLPYNKMFLFFFKNWKYIVLIYTIISGMLGLSIMYFLYMGIFFIGSSTHIHKIVNKTGLIVGIIVMLLMIITLLFPISIFFNLIGMAYAIVFLFLVIISYRNLYRSFIELK